MAMQINGYTFNKLEHWQVDFLKQNYQKLKLTELTKELQLCDETVYRLLKALGLKRKRHYHRKLPNSDEVNIDLANPYLSHVKIAQKYNTTPDVVAQRRKRAGLSVRRNTDRTLLEENIASILTSLDIAFIEQKRIGKWSLDFYLGNKTCIDIHGKWAHSKPVVIDRDRRKQLELAYKKYNYLVIHEDDIKDAKTIIIKFLKDDFSWIKQDQ